MLAKKPGAPAPGKVAPKKPDGPPVDEQRADAEEDEEAAGKKPRPFAASARRDEFDPDQPRGEDGQWVDAGGNSVSGASDGYNRWSGKTMDQLIKEHGFSKATGIASGTKPDRKVKSDKTPKPDKTSKGPKAPKVDEPRTEVKGKGALKVTPKKGKPQPGFGEL